MTLPTRSSRPHHKKRNTTLNPTIRRATTSDVSAAAGTLAAAFAVYPWTRWSIPHDDYEGRLERLQAIYLAHAVSHGLVLVASDLTGVAALLPPGCPEPTPEAQSGIAELMGERLNAVLGVTLPQRLPDSWDFATLGVHPAVAGKGLGSSLIDEALRVVAASGHPRVSLETSASENIDLYQRHGFSISHHTQIAGGPDVYTMAAELEPTEGSS